MNNFIVYNYTSAEHKTKLGDAVLSFLLKSKYNSEEASYFDQINMSKNGLEYDRKKFTPTNVNAGTWPKDYTDKP